MHARELGPKRDWSGFPKQRNRRGERKPRLKRIGELSERRRPCPLTGSEAPFVSTPLPYERGVSADKRAKNRQHRNPSQHPADDESNEDHSKSEWQEASRDDPLLLRS
jgi:hypothetical protein